jgi:hypothetical protein
MAKRTASQAAEEVVEVAFVDVDRFNVDLLKADVRTKRSGEKWISCGYLHEGNERVDKLGLRLNPGKPWTTLFYAVQEPTKDDGKKTDGAYEAFDAQVVIDEHALSVMQKISDKVQSNCKDLLEGYEWKDSHKTYTNTMSILKCKLVVKAANADQLTSCKVRPLGQKELVEARGKDQLMPLLEAHNFFCNAKVKAAISLHNIWFYEKRCGISWRLTNLVVDCREVTMPLPPVRRVFGDCFADVTFSDEDEE